MNWSAMPFMRLVLMFVFGIWSFYYFSLNKELFIACLCFTSLLNWISYKYDFGDYIHLKSTISGALLLMLFYFLGGVLFSVKKDEVEKLTHKDVELENTIFVATLNEEMKSNYGPKYVVSISQLTSNGEPIETDKLNIIAHFHPVDSSSYAYEVGDKIVAKASLKRIKSNSNPFAFDYSQYLYFKDIILQAKILVNHHQLVSKRDVSFWAKTVLKVREFGQKTLDKYITSPLEKGVVEALILGKRINLDQNVYQNYSNTGAVHVLAVSGLHVGIFISVFLAFFERIKIESKGWKLLKVCTLALLIFMYVMVTGASPSVIRAGVMITFFIIGKTYFNSVNTFNILSVTAILMLFWNPFMLFQASFQFSFLALLSILYFHPKIVDLFHPQFFILRFFWTIISVSLAAQIFIFPFTVYYFHQFPVYFAVSSLLAIPLVTLIIYVSMLMLIFEVIYVGINPYLGTFLEIIISFLNECIQKISQWPVALIENIWVSDLGLILCVAGILCMLLWWEIRKLLPLYLGLACFWGIVLEDSLRIIKNSTQGHFIVYDNFANMVADVKNQNVNTTYRVGESDKVSEDFFAKNFRMKNRITPNGLSNLSLSKVCDKIFYIYTDEDDFTLLKDGINVHALVVTNESFLSPEVVLSKINPEKIILVKNLKPWIKKKWLNLPNNKKVSIHDISTLGAFHESLICSP